MNPPKNTVVEVADQAAKKLVMEVLLDKAIKLAIKEAAWLAMPVINPLFVFLMTFAAKHLYKVITLEAALIIIGQQVTYQRDKYEAEMKELKEAIKEGRSDEEIKKQRDEAKKRLAALINFNIG